MGPRSGISRARGVDTGVALRVEAVRSAGPMSLIGVDGNSLILRLAQAYGHAAVHVGPIDIGARFGQVPERWIEQLEKGYDTRGADPLGSDRVLMFDRADLGATLALSGWKGRFDVDASFTNGEGQPVGVRRARVRAGVRLQRAAGPGE